MNIPSQVIKNSQYFSTQSCNFYQNLAKKLDKALNKKKELHLSSQSKKNYSSHSHPYIKKDIFKWFFSLDIAQKIKICSFHNKWLTQILFQMFALNVGDPRVRFFPTPNFIDKSAFDELEGDQSFSNQNDYDTFPCSSQKLQNLEYYNTFFTSIHPEEETRNDYFQRERRFLGNVRLITITDLNDTLTLSIDILNNENSFIELLNHFSDGKCFTSPINVYLDKSFNYSLPKWAINKDRFSLAQLLAIFFEQTISLNYQYYQVEQCIIPYPYDEKIDEILEMNSKIEVFLLEESAGNKSKFFDNIDFNTISREIRNDKGIIEIITNANKTSGEVFNQYCFHEPNPIHNITGANIIDESEHRLRNVFNSSIPKFVDMLTFIDASIFFKVQNFVYIKVFERLCDLYSKKTYNELMMEMTNVDTWVNNSKSGEKKKKKKKKHKKGKKNKKNENIPQKKDDSISNYIEEIDLDSIDHTKEEEKINKQEEPLILKNNFIIDNKKEEEIPLLNSVDTIIKTSEKKTNPSPQEELIKKKKEKSFFLFPITKNHLKQKKEVASKDPLTSEVPINSSISTNKQKEQSSSSAQPIKGSTFLSKQATINDTLREESNFSINLSPNESGTSKAESTEASEPKPINVNSPIINNYYIIENKNHANPYPMVNPSFHLPRNILPGNYPFGLPYFCINPFNQLSLFQINECQTFFTNFTKEIENYSSKVCENLSLLSRHKDKYIKLISALIKTTLSPFYELELLNYGSYATGLSIESSDIDILIKFKTIHSTSNSYLPLFHSNYKIEKIISMLEKAFNVNREKYNFISVTPIYTASVPVLKIQCDISRELSTEVKEQLHKNYKFNFEKDIGTIKFDLTFFEISNQVTQDTPSIPSQLVVEYIKNSLNCYPEIKPIIFVLKRYMQNLKLNSSFSGGISSFSLFLLLLAYLKLSKIYHNTKSCLGKIIFEFLECYSNLNFKIFCIDVNAPNPFILLNDLHDTGMMILDPFTSLNVAKSSFRVDEIKSAFMKALNIINKGMYSNINNKDESPQEEKTNVLYELFNLY